MASKSSQEKFALSNFEYPVNREVEASDILKSWGSFKEDKLSLTKLGENNKKAVLTFDKAGWK